MSIEVMKRALDALEAETNPSWECNSYHPKIHASIAELRSAIEAAEKVEPVAAVLADLLRDTLGPLEVSAAVIESDDTEQMSDLIRRIKTALNQWDADRAAQQKGASK